jgi:hypothetical protein
MIWKAYLPSGPRGELYLHWYAANTKSEARALAKRDLKSPIPPGTIFKRV